MRKHGGTPSRRDKHVTLAAISPPRVARGRFVGGQQSGLAGCKPPPLFTRGASSCSSQGRRQGEPWGASPRPSAPTYLPTSAVRARGLPGGWPYLLQDVRVCLLEVVEGAEEASLEVGHVLLCELGVVLGGRVLARPQQRHEAGCHHVWAEL